MTRQKTIQNLVIIFGLIALFSWLNRAPQSAAPVELDGPYQVVYVIDGDTIIIERDGSEERLRLIGIDTPERGQPYYAQAKRFTADLLDETFVYIEMDEDPYDKYGRTLCYVYLDDGLQMANALIVEAGWAKLLTIEPNDKYKTRLARALQTAITNGRGMY